VVVPGQWAEIEPDVVSPVRLSALVADETPEARQAGVLIEVAVSFAAMNSWSAKLSVRVADDKLQAPRVAWHFAMIRESSTGPPPA